MRIVICLFLLFGFSSSVFACAPDFYWNFRKNATQKELEDFLVFLRERYNFEIIQMDDQIYKAKSNNEEICHGVFAVVFFQGRIGIDHPNFLHDVPSNTCDDLAKTVVLDFLKSRNLTPEPDFGADLGC